MAPVTPTNLRTSKGGRDLTVMELSTCGARVWGGVQGDTGSIFRQAPVATRVFASYHNFMPPRDCLFLVESNPTQF